MLAFQGHQKESFPGGRLCALGVEGGLHRELGKGR